MDKQEGFKKFIDSTRASVYDAVRDAFVGKDAAYLNIENLVADMISEETLSR